MLSREVMGALALAVLWVNTLLIAAAALKARASLARMRREILVRGGVRRGRASEGAGPSSALAVLEVRQLGRAQASREPTIAFHDQGHAGRVYGGKVFLDDGGTLTIPSDEEGEVWVDASTFERSAGCAGQAAFDEAFELAKKARGFSRTVAAVIEPGRDLFVATFSTEGRDVSLVATMDPLKWIRTRTVLAATFVVAEIAVAALCTRLALSHPRFGTLSTVGGALGLAFFLSVQPLGTALRDALRTPTRAFRRGTWVRPEPAAHAIPSLSREST